MNYLYFVCVKKEKHYNIKIVKCIYQGFTYFVGQKDECQQIDVCRGRCQKGNACPYTSGEGGIAISFPHLKTEQTLLLWSIKQSGGTQIGASCNSKNPSKLNLVYAPDCHCYF